jgi:hypothetical protein
MTSGGSLQWRSRAGEERLCSVVREGEPPTTSRAPYSTQGLEGGIWVPAQQVPSSRAAGVSFFRLGPYFLSWGWDMGLLELL